MAIVDLAMIVLAVTAGALFYYNNRLNYALSQQNSMINSLRRELLEKEQQSVLNTVTSRIHAGTAYNPLLVVDQRRTILAMNREAEALFGRAAAAGESLIAVTRSHQLETMIMTALEINDEEPLEEQLTLSGRVYRARTQIGKAGEQYVVGLALQDVTDLVRLNRARRDMVANISHELRTPITNIRLIIDGLFLEVDKPRRKDTIFSLKSIARETDSLLWLVQELLDLSMIESGQAILRLVDVPLMELIDESIERVKDQLDTKEITIVKDIPEGLIVLCDRDQVRRVLINLVHNAMKWSPTGGAITITAQAADDEVIITVRDIGPGVPDEERERIFERFYQVDGSRSGKEGGTGLGLAICKHIVEAHDGRIWAEGTSRVHGGLFSFTLPPGEAKTPV